MKPIDNVEIRNELLILLKEVDHKQAVFWAIECASHVLPVYEKKEPNDKRPREAILAVDAWLDGELTVSEARKYAFRAHDAAREMNNEYAKYAARSAGQAIATIHVKDHAIYASDYAVKAVLKKEEERVWQLDKLKDIIMQSEV